MTKSELDFTPLPYVPKIFGAHRIAYRPPHQLPGGPGTIGILEAQDKHDTLNMLARALNVGRVIGFVGAGVGANYGYPLWREMAQKAIVRCIGAWKVVAPEYKEDYQRETYMLEEGLKLLRRPPSMRRDQAIASLRRIAAKAARNPSATSMQSLRSLQQHLGNSGTPFPDSMGNESLILWLGMAARLAERIDDYCQLYEARHNKPPPNLKEIGLCTTLGSYPGRVFREIIEEIFDPKNHNIKKNSRLECNPLKYMIRYLGITRFVTTNYDRSIIDSLDSYASHLSPRAIVPSPDNIDELIGFATHANVSSAGVVHLHGLVRSEHDKSLQDPLIVSDRDYQSKYYAAEHQEPLNSLRSSIAHLFRSNAFLFMGTGLSENEVIRPLRMLAAERENHPTPRELFALLENPKSEAERTDRRNFLFHTYGVRSIFFSVGDGRRGESMSRAFMRSLKEIDTARTEWWKDWRDTPLIRFPVYGSVKSAAEFPRIKLREPAPEQGAEPPASFESLNRTSTLEYFTPSPIVIRHPIIPPTEHWDSDPNGNPLYPIRFWPKAAKPDRIADGNKCETGREKIDINQQAVDAALDSTGTRVLLCVGSDGTGKRQVQDQIIARTKEKLEAAKPEEIERGDIRLVAGTTYFSFDFQSFLGYCYDNFSRIRQQKEIEELNIDDSISRFSSVLQNLRNDHTLLIDGIDLLLTNLRDLQPEETTGPLLGELSNLSSTDRIMVGDAANHSIQRIFQIIARFANSDTENHGQLVLIGSAVPQLFVDTLKTVSGKPSGFRFVRIKKMLGEQFTEEFSLCRFIQQSKELKDTFANDVAELVHRIAWHVDCSIYPLSVLDRYIAGRLEILGPSGPGSPITPELLETELIDPLRRLESYLSARARYERPGRLVGRIVHMVNQQWHDSGMNASANNIVGSDARGNRHLRLFQKLERLRHALMEIPFNQDIGINAILLRLAMFWTPTSGRSLAASFGIPFHGGSNWPEIIRCFEDVLHEMARLNLLFAVQAAPRRSWETAVQSHDESIYGRRYVVHRTMRRVMLRTLGEAPHSHREIRRFIAGTFAGEPEPKPTQTANGYKDAASALDNLLDHLENPSTWDAAPSTHSSTRNLSAPSRNMLRAAIGLLRTNWDAVSLPNAQVGAGHEQPMTDRLHLMDEYLARLSRVANLLNVCTKAAHDWSKHNPKISPRLWRDGDEDSRQWNLNGILYGHELTWFYNELGLASYIHGPLNDAYPFFESALDLTNAMNRASRHAPTAVMGKGAFGTRWAAIHANIALVRLERGGLLDALEDFSMIESVLEDIGPIESRRRTQGWIARLRYLLGQNDRALSIYNELFERHEHQLNPRAHSMFLRHRAELYRSQQNYEAALHDLNNSFAIAATANHRDQMHVTSVSRIETLFRKTQTGASFKLVDPHIAFARRYGLLKLEASFYRVQSRIALEQGYAEVAWRLALQSTDITNYNGVLLDLTASLIVLAQASRELIGIKTCKGILQQAITLANQQHYVQQRTVAEAALQDLENSQTGTHHKDPFEWGTAAG